MYNGTECLIRPERLRQINSNGRLATSMNSLKDDVHVRSDIEATVIRQKGTECLIQPERLKQINFR